MAHIPLGVANLEKGAQVHPQPQRPNRFILR